MAARSASGACSRYQIMEALGFERGLDGAQPVGALGVAIAGVVLEAGRVGEKQRGHGRRYGYRRGFGRVTLA